MNIDQLKKSQVKYLTVENPDISEWIPKTAKIISTTIIFQDTLYVAFVDKTNYYTLIRAFNSINDPENVMVSIDYQGDADGMIDHLIKHRIS